MGAGSMDGGKGTMMMPPPSSDMPGGDMDHMNKGGMEMHMTFFWGHHVQILFSGWPGDRGIGMYLLALFVVFATAVIVECLSYLPLCLSRPASQRFSNGLLLTVLSAVRTGLSYLVMLAVMSFNVGVLLAAVAGHALGFLVFGSGIFKRSKATSGVQHVAHETVLPSKC